MTRVLCTGDFHLGQGTDLGRAPGDRLQDQADVLGRIADLAAGRSVDLVLVAGDVFEGPSIPPEQLAVFAGFVKRCHTEEIPVVVCLGNGRHDAAARGTNGLAIFQHVPGVTVSSTPDVFQIGGVGVQTLPWVSPARLVAAGGRDVPRDEILAEVAGLLVEIAARGKEDLERVAPGVPHILMGHWSVSGTTLPTGLPVDALREPVISAHDLDALGFDHLVFGHIHRAQGVGERGFYVGSPLPLNFGEDTDRHAHGVCIVHTDETEAIDFYAAEFVPIESRPLVTLDYGDLGMLDADLNVLEQLHDPVASLDGAIVRLRYRATAAQQRHIDVPRIRQELADAGAVAVKIVPEIVREDRARVEGVDAHMGEQAALDAWIAANQIDDGLAERMREKHLEYMEATA